MGAIQHPEGCKGNNGRAVEPSNVYQGLRASRSPLATILAPLRGAETLANSPNSLERQAKLSLELTA